MHATWAAAAIIGALGVTGCVSSSGETPAWFSERQAMEEGGYPSLHEVPRTTTANTNDAHWAAVESELLAVGEAVKSHPRAQPGGPDIDPVQFIEEAREDLEQARAAHEP